MNNIYQLTATHYVILYMINKTRNRNTGLFLFIRAIWHISLSSSNRCFKTKNINKKARSLVNSLRSQSLQNREKMGRKLLLFL